MKRKDIGLMLTLIIIITVGCSSKSVKKTELDMDDKEVKVEFPEEVYSTIEFKQDDLPGVGIVTTSLKRFKQREVFGWHLSLMLQYDDLIENGMPSEKERELTDPFCEHLEELFKGSDTTRPNGLFLGRFTWNGTRELIWKIHDPEIADKELKRIIDANDHPRPFDYRIDPDPEWKLSKWHLDE